MDDAAKVEQLRELLLGAPESHATRLLAVLGSLVLAATVLYLVRRRVLREEYTPIWMAVAAGVVLISVDMDLLRALTRAIGAWAPSSTIFFLGEVFLVAICLNFAVRLSQAQGRIRTLAQEVALLRQRLDEARPASDPGRP